MVLVVGFRDFGRLSRVLLLLLFLEFFLVLFDLGMSKRIVYAMSDDICRGTITRQRG